MNEYVDNEARKARLVGKTVTMAHGAGGRQTSELIDMIFKAHFDNPDLTADDAAVLTPPIGKMAVSTDGFIVSPAFYPGGNIGKLSICGTVNDLSCMGAKPLYLTCAFVIEEGFPMEKLEEIAEAMEKVSTDGVITIEEGKTAETYSEVVEGMQFDRGYMSPYMITDREKMKVVYDDALVFITDKTISNIQDILPMLEQIVKMGKKLLIIAEDIEGEALTTIILNNLRGTFKCAAVKAPGFGDRRKEMLQDIAILTGGTVLSSDLGMELADANVEMLGKVSQAVIDKENTILVGGAGTSEAIEERIAEIKNQIAVSTSDFDKEKMQERIGKLSGGVAVIKVGAATEVEMKEKKLRIEDALSATKAAVEEGIVAGGGTALINAIPAVEKLVPSLDGDEKTGAKIVLRALEAPLRQIAANAGLEGSIIVDKIRRSRKVGYGFDAYNETYCDMMSSGIVDPTKVTRSALQNAASIASMVLTTESAVANIPKEEPAAAAPAAGGMGGMY